MAQGGPEALSGPDLEALAWRLRSVVGEDNVELAEPMSEHTTF